MTVSQLYDTLQLDYVFNTNSTDALSMEEPGDEAIIVLLVRNTVIQHASSVCFLHNDMTLSGSISSMIQTYVCGKYVSAL